MANGKPPEIQWLKDLIFATVLSIPYWQFAEIEQLQPAGFSSTFTCKSRSVELQILLDCIHAMGEGNWQKMSESLDGVEKDRLTSIAMAALSAGRGQSLGCSLPLCFSPTRERAQLPLQPFIRLIAGFDMDVWCGTTGDIEPPKGDGCGTLSAEGKPLIRCLIDRVAAGTEANRAWLRHLAWELAQTHQGSLILQQAVTIPSWPEAKKILLHSLDGNIWEACRHAHANFALQEYMRWLPAESWRDMVLRELKGHCEEAAKHDTGCRVLQRLIEHTNLTDAEPVLSEIINDRNVLHDLMLDKFGNYVVQHLFEHDAKGTQQQRVIDAMCRDDLPGKGIHDIASHRVASHVVDQALTYCKPACLAQLVEALLRDATKLHLLQKGQWGSFVFKNLIKLLDRTLKAVKEKENGSKPSNYPSEWWYRCNLLVKALLNNQQSLPRLKLDHVSALQNLCDADPDQRNQHQLSTVEHTSEESSKVKGRSRCRRRKQQQGRPGYDAALCMQRQ
jgi:hypothetical protein